MDMKLFHLLLICLILASAPAISQTNTFPSTGPVGIGTLAPDEMLTIKYASGNSGGMAFRNPDNTPIFSVYTDQGTNAILNGYNDLDLTATFGSIKYLLNGQEAMRLSPEGNLGIGTASPPAVAGWKLVDVTSSGSNSRIYLHAAGQAGVNGGGALAQVNNDLYLQNYQNAALIFGTNAANMMRLSPGGNLLVGTAADAGYKLDIAGTTRSTGALTVGDAAVASGRITLQSLDRADFRMKTGGSTDDAFSIYAYGGNTGSNYCQLGTNRASLYLDTRTNIAPFRFFTATTDLMDIFSSGNVGIGMNNTDNGYKLAVNGDVAAKRIQVTPSGWPDYVFDSAYALPGLPEVERFIQSNKHLPGMPSAAAVEKTGVDLGGNQAVLLKKIEELTLYIIEQNKRIEKLEKSLAGRKAAGGKK